MLHPVLPANGTETDRVPLTQYQVPPQLLITQ